MAKQTINIGAAPNDGTGDPLRTAFDKTNDNFDELYARSGGVIGTATFEPSGGGGGTIGNLVTTGVISGVSYLGAGDYLVTLSPEQANSRYAIVVQVYDAGAAVFAQIPPANKEAVFFNVKCAAVGGVTAADPAFIQLLLIQNTE